MHAITFAPNVDAETYGEPPPLIDPPSSALFPARSDSELPSPRRASHARKKPDDWIPRPPNAFILFRSEMVEQFIKSQHVPGDVEANHGNLSKIIGLCWRNLPFPERSVWEHKARLAQAAHKAQYPNYRFRPHTKGAGAGGAGGDVRRRVKEPPAPPDARRVAHIAGLLVDGVKGAKLARAVRALDEERKPRKVEMRFDEPVTAAQFGGGASEEEREEKPVRTKRAGAKRRKVQPEVAEKEGSVVREEEQAQQQQQSADPFLATFGQFSVASPLAWSPTEDTGTWSEDTGTWSSPEDNTGTWSSAEDTGTWSPAPPPTTWSPAPNPDTAWSPAPDYTWAYPQEYSPQAYSPQEYSPPAYAPVPALFPPPELELGASPSPAASPERSPALAPAPPYMITQQVQCGVDLTAQFGAMLYDSEGTVPHFNGVENLHEYARAVQCFEY